MIIETSFYKYIILLVFMCNHYSSTYAQSLQSDTSLSKVYRFDLREESDEGFITTYYDAFDQKDHSNPFEIICTKTSNKLMNMRGVTDRLKKLIQTYYPDSKFLLIRKEEKKGINRFLYQFSIKNVTTLMLMQENNNTFLSTEAEIPNDEFDKVSVKQWQDVFWNVAW